MNTVYAGNFDVTYELDEIHLLSIINRYKIK